MGVFTGTQLEDVEIKFRFWNYKLWRMSRPYGLGIIYENLMREWDSCDWPDIKILQYTGLHDKNGKEIYEGDIVQSDYERHPMAIKWLGHGFWCERDTHDEIMPNEETMEVIGNIYENPELLEGK